MSLQVLSLYVIKETPTSSYAYADVRENDVERLIAVDPDTLQIDRNDPRKGDRNDPEFDDKGGWEGLDLDALDSALAAFAKTDKIRRIKAF